MLTGVFARVVTPFAPICRWVLRRDRYDRRRLCRKDATLAEGHPITRLRPGPPHRSARCVRMLKSARAAVEPTRTRRSTRAPPAGLGVRLVLPPQDLALVLGREDREVRELLLGG